MTDEKIGPVDGDEILEHIESNINLAGNWPEESDYEKGKKNERLITLATLKDDIRFGRFSLPPVAQPDEGKMRELDRNKRGAAHDPQ